MLGGIIMIIGAILQTTSFSYTQMVVARIITGLGNGLNVSLVPSLPRACLDRAESSADVDCTLVSCGVLASRAPGQPHHG